MKKTNRIIALAMAAMTALSMTSLLRKRKRDNGGGKRRRDNRRGC
ncbi:MAG: hypothetical protein ACLTR6_04620 [Clostridium fessum]